MTRSCEMSEHEEELFQGPGRQALPPGKVKSIKQEKLCSVCAHVFVYVCVFASMWGAGTNCAPFTILSRRDTSRTVTAILLFVCWHSRAEGFGQKREQTLRVTRQRSETRGTIRFCLLLTVRVHQEPFFCLFVTSNSSTVCKIYFFHISTVSCFQVQCCK